MYHSIDKQREAREILSQALSASIILNFIRTPIISKNLVFGQGMNSFIMEY